MTVSTDSIPTPIATSGPVRSPQTVFVGFKFSHMGCHTGYDVIRHHAGYAVQLDCQRSFDAVHAWSQRRSLWSRVFSRLIGSRMWWIELQCLLLALRRRGAIFHFVYAENTYRYLGWFRWLNIRIVCTYHQPKEFFETHSSLRKSLRRVDDVIVLAEDQVEAFKAWKGDDRVHYIPHGVDTDFFRPDPTQVRQRQVIMVGNWLRDFAFADQVFHNLFERFPDLEIHVVACRENLNLLSTHPRLHLRCGISNEQLLRLYQTARLLFLPLGRFVANNAILEAAACGCPVLVASDQPYAQYNHVIAEQVPKVLDVVTARIAARLDQPTPEAECRNWINTTVSWPIVGSQTRRVLDGCQR